LSAEVKTIKQHADMPHLLLCGAQSIVNSARCHQVRAKTGRLVQVKRVPATGGWALPSVLFRALRRGGGGSVRVRAVKQGVSSAEFSAPSL
jgi:hypothetical protein